MNKLIKMEDYVLEQNEFSLYKHNADDIRQYAKLLKSNPTLSMFVPCDDGGNVLEEPKLEDMPKFVSIDDEDQMKLYAKFHTYQAYLSDVIFDGWGVIRKAEMATILINDDSHELVFYLDGSVAYNQRTITSLSDLTPYNLSLKNKS